VGALADDDVGALARAARLGGGLRPRPRRNGQGAQRGLDSAARATTTLTRDYAAVMERAKLPADFDHFFGYLNLRMLLELLKRAGNGVTSQSLVTANEALGKVDLGGYTVSFGPQNHHGSSDVDLLIVGPGGRFMR
jgi:hypothetical protein